MIRADSAMVAQTWLNVRAAAARLDPLTVALGGALLLLLALQIGLALRGISPVLDGRLVDTDDYLRLARVAHLWQSGDWFDPVFPRIAPPSGLELHWTRPMDVLLLLGAALGAPVFGFEAALHGWGVVIGPLLHGVALLAIVWACRPVLRRPWLYLLPFLFVVQPAILMRFLVGRPDHHGLLLLVFIVQIGLIVRLLVDPERRREAIAAGALGALGVWISVESLLIVALSVAALGLRWLFGEPRYGRLLMIHGLAMVVAAVVALLIERGLDLLSAENDRFSVVHVSIFAVNLAFWGGMALLDRRDLIGAARAARIGWAGLGAIAAVAVLWLLHPDIFDHPMGGGDSLFKSKYLAHILELQPVLGSASAAGEAPFARAVLWLGLALPAVPWLLLRVLRAPAPERWVWVFLGLMAATYVPLAAHQVRWSPYAELVLLLPYAALAGMLLEWLPTRLPEARLALVRPFVAVALGAWPYFPAGLPNEAQAGSLEPAAARGCPLKELAPVLNDPAGLGSRPRTILALIDFGPELLYRTGHGVLTVPNHRYQPAFAATYHIMGAREPTHAWHLLDAWPVDLVLVCLNSAEARIYDSRPGAATLHQALREGAPPPFLTPVTLPDALAASFRLYSVRPPSP